MCGCLNCSLAITSSFYLIIVVNEPQQKIIRYQSVEGALIVISESLRQLMEGGCNVQVFVWSPFERKIKENSRLIFLKRMCCV